MNCRKTWMGFAAIVCSWSGSACIAQIEAPNLPANLKVLELAFEPSLGEGVLVASVNIEQSKYWIGLLCIDLSDALRSQLNLESDVGLLVDAVTKDSPAGKQGLERNDILLSARLVADPPEKESSKLSQVADLVKIVQAAETKPVQFEVLRRGVRKTIEVTPVERPALDHVRLRRDPGDDKTQRIHSAAPEANDFRMFIAGPIFESVWKQPSLPEGVSMEFHQVVGEREKITVKKGDQKWETTVDDLAKLPEEIRVTVLQQLTARRSVPVPHIAPFPPTVATPHGTAMVPTPPGVAVRQHVITNGLPRMTVNETAGNRDATKAVSIARVVFSSTADLPENVTLSIVRKGTDPAKITVKKDEQSWEVTDKELNKLPEDVRKLVEPIIANQRKTARVESAPQMINNMRTIFLNESATGGNSSTKTTSPDQPTPVAPGLAETQRQRALTGQKDRVELFVTSKLQARQEAIEKQVNELSEKLQSLNELKLINEKIEKLQQSLDRLLPKE